MNTKYETRNNSAVRDIKDSKDLFIKTIIKLYTITLKFLD